MKIKKLIIMASALMLPAIALAKIVFTVEGPESSYNQIWVINETSQTDFKCRVSVLNDDESVKEIYGIYNLKEKGDKDSNTHKIKQGSKVGVEIPGDFPVEVDYTLEYKDYPLFDVIIVHLYDQDKGWK